MNLLDIGLIALLLIPALIGLFKGLVNMATAFVAIWAAFLLAPLCRHLLESRLLSLIGDEGLASVVAYAIGFVATILTFGLLGWLVTRSLQKLDLQWANRLAGMVLGLVSGLLIGGVAVAALQTADPEGQLAGDSVLAPPIGALTRSLIAMESESAEAEGTGTEPELEPKPEPELEDEGD